MIRVLSFCLFLFFVNNSAAQRIAAFEMNSRLGRGVNIGNAFEAPTETAWGNPWQPEYFKIISDLGFKHVRLPIRWETNERSMANAPYTINPTFLARIKEVVDHAHANNLMIIINMHHHDLLFQDPDGQKPRFLAQWAQIADYFKNYSEQLLFEVLNEPHAQLTPEKWNVFFAEALNEIRKTNPDRIVLMGTAEFGGLSAVSKLQLPDDENIIVSVHYYNPFNFTHQGAEWVGSGSNQWLGTKWNDLEMEREAIISEFEATFRFSTENKVPVNVGEFGAYSKADLESRVRWTNFLARWFEEKKLSWAYWEFSAGFGIYDPRTKTFVQPLVDALLHNELPPPTQTSVTSIYKSNFSVGNDGWSLNLASGATASHSVASGLLNISVQNGGTETWHVQLVKSNIPLVKGKMYMISIKAKASSNSTGTFYVGRASTPWNSYSGYTNISLSPTESTFSTVFTMTGESDNSARIALDIGKTANTIQISEVRLEEIKILVTSVEKTSSSSIKIYPNPFQSQLNIRNIKDYSKAIIYDLSGRKILEMLLKKHDESLELGSLLPGSYILKFIGFGNKGEEVIIIKN
jgi:endoglucanase